MTKDNTTLSVRQAKPLRRLKVRTVCDADQQSYSEPVGQIRLKGKWLNEAGFSINMPVKVRIMQGCLVLTTQPSPKPEGFTQLTSGEQNLVKTLIETLLT